MRLETPREYNLSDGTILPFNVCTRGGQYAPLYAGDIYSNDEKVITHRSYAHLAMGDDSAEWLKININQTDNIYGAGWMMCFTIRVYQSYRATDIQICGYNYSSNYWYLPSAKIICDSQGLSKTVTFGYDGVDKLWVAIACDNYSGIDILDVTSGYYDAEVSFDINPVDSLTGTIQSEQTIYPPITQNAFSYSNGTLTITT